MHRLHGAFIVLTVVISLAVTSFLMNTSTARIVCEHLQQAYQLAENNDKAASLQHINDAAKILKERRQWLCLFISHQRIDSIEQAVEQASLCLRQQNIMPFLLYCSSALELTDDFQQLEYPYLYNII